MFYFRFIPLYLLLVNVLGYTAPYYDLENADQHFADFVNKYERKYESSEEYNRRFEIFKQNLKKINIWNDRNKHDEGGYAVTQFSDQDGHKSCFVASKLRSSLNYTLQVKREFIENAPDHLDYREQHLVTEVKDQGGCGSCFVFGALGNIEGMHAKATGNLISLSEQQGFDCDVVESEDCENGGDSINVIESLAIQGGSMSEHDYPYYSVRGTCHTDKSKIKVKVLGGYVIQTPDVQTLKGALYQNGAPLTISFFVSNQFLHIHGRVIANPTDCYHQEPNHSVLLVGYSTDRITGNPYWIIKNSWGKWKGDNGYYYIGMESSSTCSLLVEGAITSTVQ